MACAVSSMVCVLYVVSDFNSTKRNTTGFLNGTVDTLTTEGGFTSNMGLIKGRGVFMNIVLERVLKIRIDGL